MADSDQVFPPDISTDVPTPARMYDYCLGGKDNFAVDREASMAVSAQFPEGLDVTRENRLFLYRVVRYLARDAGIHQFLDLGSGLPAQRNVHEVAQEFHPDAHVVYVDNDPIVLAHGRALLADNNTTTTVVTADMTEPAEILAHPDVHRLIDFTRPLAALFMSVPHSIPDDAVARHTLSTVADALPSGSHLALSQMTGVDHEAARESNELTERIKLPWKTRTADELRELVAGLDLEPVSPGWTEVRGWRPDPDQPPLSPVDEPLRPFLGMGAENRRIREYGAVLRKT